MEPARPTERPVVPHETEAPFHPETQRPEVKPETEEPVHPNTEEPYPHHETEPPVHPQTQQPEVHPETMEPVGPTERPVVPHETEAPFHPETQRPNAKPDTGNHTDSGCVDSHPEACPILCASICEVEGLDDVEESVGLAQRKKRSDAFVAPNVRLFGWLWGNNEPTTKAPLPTTKLPISTTRATIASITTTTATTTTTAATTTTTTKSSTTTPVVLTTSERQLGLSVQRCKKLARLADHVILALCPKSCDVCGRHTNRERLAQCYVRGTCHMGNHLHY